jgi:predicted nucleic acid-binding protein
VRLAELDVVVPAGERIVLDSSVLIAYFTGGEATSRAAARIVDGWLRAGRNAAFVSAVSVMECLVRAARSPGSDADALATFFEHWPNLSVVDVNTAIARSAATIRATLNVPPPDALILGTASVAAVGDGRVHVITGDRRWQRGSASMPDAVSIVYLHDHIDD